MLIDLHACSNATNPSGPDPARVIRAAKEAGLDGIAFVEEMSSRNAKAVFAAGAEADFPVFVGVELPTTTGRFLCFAPDPDPFLSREEWRQLMAGGIAPNYKSLFELFESVGGAVIASQPYTRGKGSRLGDSITFCDGLHGVEVTTSGTSRIDRVLAVEAAVKLGLPTTAGSARCQRPSDIGRSVTLFATGVTDQASLVAALRAGDFWAVAEDTGERPQRRGRGRDSEGRGDGRREGRGSDRGRGRGRSDRDGGRGRGRGRSDRDGGRRRRGRRDDAKA